MGRVTALHRGMAQGLALSIAALALIGLGSISAQASSASDFVAKINAARAEAGRPSLTVRGDLAAAAQAQAQRMADRSDLFHNPNLAGSVSHWSSLAENVGYGPDVATIHQAFMRSPGHRANILQTKFTEVGLGVVVRDHVMWVAEVFRLPSSGATQAGGTKAATKAKPAPARSTKQPVAKPASSAAPVKAEVEKSSTKARAAKRTKPRIQPPAATEPPALALRVLAIDLRTADATFGSGSSLHQGPLEGSGRDSGSVRAELTVTFAMLALVALVGVARARIF